MTKAFARFARKARIESHSLKAAASEVAAGRFNADLGGNVFKQRIARPGAGRSGGYRTIILFKAGGHSFFAHGFAKNDKANLSPKELESLKKLAKLLLGVADVEIEALIAEGELVKVEGDGSEAQEG